MTGCAQDETTWHTLHHLFNLQLRRQTEPPVPGPHPPPHPNDFDADDAESDERVARRAEVAEALAEHGLTDTLVVSRERAEDLFHDRRLAILDHLADHEPRSVRALAEALDLDKGVVSRDLQRLARIDVVEYVEQGRTKAPRLRHDHVVVEPVV